MVYSVHEAPLPGARRLRLLVGALLSVCVFGLVAAQHAAADSWPYAQSAAALGFPSDALSGGSSSLDGTACATIDSCVTVGYYEDTSSNYEAYLQPITDGIPGAAVRVTLPANADTSSQDAYLNGVSCGSSNTCEAYGYYYDSSAVQQPMVVQITDGVPATAVEVTPPTDAVAGDVSLDDISCVSSSSCELVGYYQTTPSNNDVALVVPISDGVPGTAAVPSLPADSYSTPDSELSSVACQASGSCAAVGYYYNTANDETALEVPIINGVVGAGVETLPNDANTNPQASLSYVACPTSGACEAIGYYYNSSGDEENMVVPITAGAPGTATAAVPPANHASADSYVYLDGLSCSSASLCVAAGYSYYGASGDYEAALTLITSSGASSQAATLPSDASTTSPDSEFGDGGAGSVGCVPSGPCLATGYYYAGNAGSSYSGLAEQVSAGGQAGTAVVTPAPADSYSPQYSYLYGGTACDTAGSCVATGDYYSTTANAYMPYEVTEQAPLSVTTTSLAGATQNSPYQSTLAATGAWGSYTWSLSSGSLPAGLSLDSQTGVISGTPTGSGTSTFTAQVTGTGSPVPTATQSLSLTVAPAAVTTTTTTPTPKAKPRVLVLAASGRVRSDRVSVRLRCTGARCSGAVKLDVRELVIIKHGHKRVRKHRTVMIGSARYSLSAGATKVIKVKLNAAGRSALAKAKRHHVVITIIATVNGGKQASRHETIWTVSKKK
jgi:hypothetical protein